MRTTTETRSATPSIAFSHYPRGTRSVNYLACTYKIEDPQACILTYLLVFFACSLTVNRCKAFVKGQEVWDVRKSRKLRHLKIAIKNK